MRQRDHPAHGRLGHGSVDRAGGDENDNIGGGTRLHIHRVVPDAEPADREQITALGNRLAP